MIRNFPFQVFLKETRMPDTPDDKTLSESAVQVSFTSIGPYRLIQMLGVGLGIKRKVRRRISVRVDQE